MMEMVWTPSSTSYSTQGYLTNTSLVLPFFLPAAGENISVFVPVNSDRGDVVTLGGGRVEFMVGDSYVNEQMRVFSSGE